MFVINIASPIYEQAETWQVYSRVTFTENMKNKLKAISMQRAALSQSLMSHLLAGAHLPWTDAADGKPRGLLCTGASQPLVVTMGSGTNSGIREIIGLAMARILPQIYSVI